jgi:RNA polymerase sigma-70 factor (ECF subfamily)
MCHRTASDDDLMRATAAGDRAAFAELMQRHQSWVRSLMVAFVRHEAQAEDLTQEAFCRAFQHADTYAGRGHFVAWLKRVAVNLAKDSLRRQAHGPSTCVPFHECEETAVADHRFEPMMALASGALRDDLRAAIQALPDEQRLPVVMHYFGDMALQDIAWAMKCPVGTVKSRLFYALRRVRQTLTTVWQEEEGGSTA